MCMEDEVKVEEVCVVLPLVETPEDVWRAIIPKRIDRASTITRAEIVLYNGVDLRESGVFPHDCERYSFVDALIKISSFIPVV